MMAICTTLFTSSAASPLSPAAALATNPGDLKPVDALSLTMPLAIVIAACLLLAIVLAVLAVVLSRPSRKPKKAAQPHGAHSGAGTKGVWRDRIADVVARHEAGTLSREDAFAQLALIAREFAGTACGRELSSSTLTDLARLDRTQANRQGLNTLRQTIEALYPPEFADVAFNQAAKDTTVRQAAEWVSNLVERWRS